MLASTIFLEEVVEVGDLHPQKRETKQFMSDLHWWMPACLDEEKRCLSALRALTNLTSALLQQIAQKRSAQQSRSHFTYHVLHTTPATKPMGKVQQAQGEKGFEVLRAIERWYDQKNTEDAEDIRQRNQPIAPSAVARNPLAILCMLFLRSHWMCAWHFLVTRKF